MTVHAHSCEAFAAFRAEGAAGRRQRRILELASKRATWTDREMAEALGFDDLNAVRPRVTEMLADGLLVECGACQCPRSGRKVRLWRLASSADACPAPVLTTSGQYEFALGEFSGAIKAIP